MKNAKIIIVGLLFIFLISGGYALYSEGDLLGITATNEVQNNSQVPETEIPNNDKSIVTDTPNNLYKKEINIYPTKAVDLITQKYAIKYGAGKNLTLNENTVNMFIQCACCGRFAPYGDVSKQLPEEALCPYIQNVYVGSGDCDEDHAYTYDEAMAIWEHDGSASLACIKEYSDLGLDIHRDDLPEDTVQVPSQPQNNEVQNVENLHYEIAPYDVA